MTRSVVLVALQLAAAAVAFALTFSFLIARMFDPGGATRDVAFDASLLLIGVFALGGIVASCSGPPRRRVVGGIVAAVLALASGFIVPAIDAVARLSAERARLEDNRRADAEFLAELKSRED